MLQRRIWSFGLAVLMAVPLAAVGVALTAQAAGAAPTITSYANPHTIAYACDITNGPDGALWFTNYRGNSIGRITTGGALTTYTGTGVSSPCAITVGPDGALWFTNVGNDSIGRITTAGTVTNFPSVGGNISIDNAENPGGIAAGADGALWFTNSFSDTIGRITTGGAITTYTGTGVVGPRSITAGSDGALWFTNGGSIGRVTTAGVVTNFTNAGVSNPIGITSGPDGALWFANLNGQGSIGRITTAGAFATYSDPSISGARSITVGPDGALWFTNVSSSSIGRITTAGVVSHFAAGAISAPIGITAGPDGALWFTDYAAVWRVTSTGTFTEFRATGTVNPVGIAAGPDGAMWFTNPGNDSIGRIDMAGTVTNFTGTGVAYPQAITEGSDGALWFTNRGNNSIGRITTAGVVTNYASATIANPFNITAGPDGALWFTNHDNNSIGRITTAGTITKFAGASISGPFDITAGPDGALWFTNSGNNSIGRMTTAGVVTTFTHISISSPDGITTGPDGALWFTNNGHNANWIDRITTAGTVTKVNAVIGYAITSGPDGALWLTDPTDGLVARVTTSGNFTSFFDPGIKQPYGIAAGPDGAMWTVDASANSVVRITMPTPPGAPTIGTATARNAAASVTFIAPTDTGGAVIDGYTASCASSNGGATGSGPGTTSPISVSGLTNGKTYTCTVTATNERGTSSVSSVSNSFVPMPTVPEQPTNVVVTRGNQSASVAFTAPANDGGSTISDYEVSCTSTTGGTAGSASGAGSPLTVSGLSNGAFYYCTVSATNGSGVGAASEVSNEFVPATVPDPPTSVSASRGNGSLSVGYSWALNDGGTAFTGFSADCTSTNGGLFGSGTGDYNASLIVVSGLTNGRSYQCKVTALNAVGSSVPSDPSALVIPATVPGAPATTNVIPYGDKTARVSWSVPAMGGSAVTKYRVTPYRAGIAQPVRVFNGTATTVVVTGLDNRQSYQFTIAAVNSVGIGASSAKSAAMIAGAPGLPGKPAAVRVAAGSLKVAWGVPSNDGAVITSSTVTCTSSNGGVTRAKTAAAGPITVAALTAGRIYTCRVRSTNIRGAGPLSVPSAAVKV